MGHDERFKLLLREFLREFFELFFPDLVGQLDFAAAVWLQQELITDPPAGEKRTIDLLVHIPLLQAADEAGQTVLIHIEVESDDTVEPFRRRMYEYYHHLTPSSATRCYHWPCICAWDSTAVGETSTRRRSWVALPCASSMIT